MKTCQENVIMLLDSTFKPLNFLYQSRLHRRLFFDMKLTEQLKGLYDKYLFIAVSI